MEAGCEKNLRFSSRSPRTSNFFPKSLQSARCFQIWLFLDPGTKKNRFQMLLKICHVRKYCFCRDPTNSERRFAPVLCQRLRRTVRSPRLSYRLERSRQRTGANRLWRPVTVAPFRQHPIIKILVYKFIMRKF